MFCQIPPIVERSKNEFPLFNKYIKKVNNALARKLSLLVCCFFVISIFQLCFIVCLLFSYK